MADKEKLDPKTAILQLLGEQQGGFMHQLKEAAHPNFQKGFFSEDFRTSLQPGSFAILDVLEGYEPVLAELKKFEAGQENDLKGKLETFIKEHGTKFHYGKGGEIGGGDKLTSAFKILDGNEKAMDAVKALREPIYGTKEQQAHGLIDKMTKSLDLELNPAQRRDLDTSKYAGEPDWKDSLATLRSASKALRDEMKAYATALYGDKSPIAGMDKGQREEFLNGFRDRIATKAQAVQGAIGSFIETHLQDAEPYLFDPQIGNFRAGLGNAQSITKGFNEQAKDLIENGGVQDIQHRQEMSRPDRGGMQI
ncbi:MAG: hypothetical protein MRY32_04440 [Rickettsiales bacterium]|nr:hypothetical protein [Rickettsiales bacterium]